MMRYLCLAALLLLVAAPAFPETLPIRPDQALTPGQVATTDEDDVCGIVGGKTYSKRHRATPKRLKDDTYEAYGIDKRGRDFEIDHRVPLCLGSADVAENLWPQLGWAHPSYYDKDRLEKEFCRRVCDDGEMTLREGQAIFLRDWIRGYEQVYGETPQ
jgi:hypothetical protein